MPRWMLSLARISLAGKICLIALVITILAATWHLGSLGIDYEWQWNRAWRYLGQFQNGLFIPGPLLEGVAVTAVITVFGLILAVVLGLGAALLRISPWPICSALAWAYVGAWRNTPLLLQLFFAYFLISPLLDLGPGATAVIALGAFEGAYVAEILRGGILSVPRSQWEAAFSLGFGARLTLVKIILPQALDNAWPALTNQGIAILKTLHW